MLVVFCVDLDDDLGRKTGIETPVIGEAAVEEAAVALATADPEDSDVNVLFEGLHIARDVTGESVTVAAVTGNEREDVTANREVGREVDEVLASLTTGESIQCIVVTDGAQDESVVPVIRSRVTIDGVRRVVVRQAQDLESMYYTIKQVLNDPETRGTVLVPLGILLLIYPMWVIVNALGVVDSALPDVILGLTSGLMGLYVLSRGIGLGSRIDEFVYQARNVLYAGRATVITYVVALALLVIGGVSGVEHLQATQATVDGTLDGIEALAALLFGSVRWFAAAALTTSVGQITDEYLADRLEWRYLNAPFYVVAIAGVLHTVSAYLLGVAALSTLAAVLTAATLLALASTLAFAIVESRSPEAEPA